MKSYKKTELHELNFMHKQLRKARYFYYEKSKSIMTDYEYDIIEKRYDELCYKYKICEGSKITNFVGFNIAIPMALIYT